MMLLIAYLAIVAGLVTGLILSYVDSYFVIIASLITAVLILGTVAIFQNNIIRDYERKKIKKTIR